MQNLQYLYKSSIFMLNLQYLYICVLYFLLSLICVQVDLCLTSGVRERDYCSGFVLFVSKSSILRICSHIGTFIFSLFCVQADLSSFRSQREEKFVFICIFVFLYII